VGRIAPASRQPTCRDPDPGCNSRQHRWDRSRARYPDGPSTPTEVVLGRRQGLPVPCVANFDNILTVPRHRLKRLMGACDASKVEELNQAIKAALDVR